MFASLNELCLDFIVEYVKSLVHNFSTTGPKENSNLTTEYVLTNLPVPPNLIRLTIGRLRAKDEWIKKHRFVLKNAERFQRRIVWLDNCNIDNWSTALNIFRDFDNEENLTYASKFELACVYCVEKNVSYFWTNLSHDEISIYLTDGSSRCDPVVKYWTAICSNRFGLADMFLVRAFYYAAEHNFVEAVAHFWQIIERERSEAVIFRAVRAFQLGAFHGHMQILMFFWSKTNEEQRRQMIQSALNCTEGSLRLLENACKFGRLDILQFLYNEATHELRQLMLRAYDCSAFRLAVDENQTEIVRFFFEKASRLKLCCTLLEADDFSAFRKITVSGRLNLLKLFWDFADQEERQALLTAPFYLRRDLKEAVCQRGFTEVAKFLWENCSADLKEVLLSNCLAPCLSESSFQSFLGALDAPFKLIDDESDN